MVFRHSARDRLAGLMRWGHAALPVLALLALVTAVLYWRALRCGVISDAWVLLWIASHELPKALFWQLSYHIIPVTHLISTILWNLFGLWEPGYQLVNLLELLLAAWLVYFFGLRLFRGAHRHQVALLAALLLLANASFYEVACWPVVGNFQIAAGLLQLGGLFAVHRAVRSARPALWAFLFGLAAVLAFFTYEPALSLLPAGVLYAALVPPAGGDRSWPQMRRRAAPLLAAAVLAFLPMIAVKIHAVSSGNTALFLPKDPHEVAVRLQYLIRGCIGIFTLRGSDEAAVVLYHPAGLVPAWGSLTHALFLAGWLAVLLGLTLFPALRSREPALLFLGLWFWIYVCTVSVATIFVSRQSFLAAIPASLLMAWGIFRLAEVVSGTLGAAVRRERPELAAVLAFVAFGLLALGGKTDLDAAADLHQQATKVSRHVRELILQRAAAAPLNEVAMINMPARLVHRGIGAFFFINGIQPMVLLASNDISLTKSIRFWSTSPDVGNLAEGTHALPLPEILRKVEDPRCLVLWFDPRSRTVVELNPASWQLPREVSPETFPFLRWENELPPRLRLLPGQPFEIPVTVEEPGSWMAVQIARGNPGLSFDVTEGEVPRLKVRPREIRTPSWPVIPFPISATAGSKSFTFHPQTEMWIAGLWSFTPPERYTPAAAPFLSWMMQQADPALAVHEETLRLPLSTRRCGPAACAVTIEVLAAPGRDAVLSIEGGERRELAFPADAPSTWRTLSLAPPPGETAVLRIEPRGLLPVLLRRIEAGPAPASSVTAPETDTLVSEKSTGSP